MLHMCSKCTTVIISHGSGCVQIYNSHNCSCVWMLQMCSKCKIVIIFMCLVASNVVKVYSCRLFHMFGCSKCAQSVLPSWFSCVWILKICSKYVTVIIFMCLDALKVCTCRRFNWSWEYQGMAQVHDPREGWLQLAAKGARTQRDRTPLLSSLSL